jgi:hypothetical protein
MMGAQRGDAFTGPSVAMAGDEAIPVQDAGDEIVTGDQHELANGGDHVG